MIKAVFTRKTILSIAAVLALCLTLSSCDTLKKKFTRKKKGKAEDVDFNPVLEPQEYPAPEANPLENYKQHYALLKVWYKDVWTDLQDKSTDKRMMYTLNQLKGQIESLRALVNEEKQQEFDKLSSFLKYYEDALNQPAPLRNRSRIESDLRAFYHQLLSKLTVAKVKGSFVPINK